MHLSAMEEDEEPHKDTARAAVANSQTGEIYGDFTIEVPTPSNVFLPPTTEHVVADAAVLKSAINAVENALHAGEEDGVSMFFVSSTYDEMGVPISPDSDVRVVPMPEVAPRQVDIGDAYLYKPDGSWSVVDVEVPVALIAAAHVPDSATLSLSPLERAVGELQALVVREQLVDIAVGGVLENITPGARLEIHFEPDAGKTLGLQ